jgi:hypothetical protein
VIGLGPVFGYDSCRHAESGSLDSSTRVQGDEAVAKRKSTSAAKPQAAAPSARSGSASGNGVSPPSTRKAGATTQPAFSPQEIGNAAGEIWALLSNNGEQTLAAIKKSVDTPSEVVLAAIGWLAREDKLEFATSGRTVKISLR